MGARDERDLQQMILAGLMPAGSVRRMMLGSLGDDGGGSDGYDGSAYTSDGRISIKQSVHARDPRPLEEGCGCRTCTRLSRAYLRHLYISGEILAARALTEHNLYFYARLMAGMQAAIASRTYRDFAAQTLARLGGGRNAAQE